MKIAHLSDLHFGDRTLEEALRCTTHAVDEAIRLGVDCTVISGDATDHAVAAHSPALTSVAHLVRRLADHCPVLMLQGTYSHEPPGTLDVFRLLGGRFPIFVADRISQVVLHHDGHWTQSPGHRWTSTLPSDAMALFSCLPTVNKANVAAAVGAIEADAAVGDHVAAVLAGFGVINRGAREAHVATIGVSHGTVNGCVTEHGVPMAGLDHEFATGALFGAEASAFMLGHIHKHQFWENAGRVIAYPGSIGRFTYGEKGDKGFLLWDVEATGALCELVRTPAQRTVELEFAGVPDAGALATLAAEVGGARVRVRWTIDEDDRDRVDRMAIETLLVAAGAVDVKLEGRVLPKICARSAGIAKALTVEDKLAKWAAVNGASETEMQRCLAALMSRDTEAIAAEILAQGKAQAEAITPVRAQDLEVTAPNGMMTQPNSEEMECAR